MTMLKKEFIQRQCAALAVLSLLFLAVSVTQAQACEPGSTSEKAGVPLICNEDGIWEMADDYDGDDITMDEGIAEDEYETEEEDKPFDFASYFGSGGDVDYSSDDNYQSSGGGNDGMAENEGDNASNEKKEIIISSSSETECSGNDCAPGTGGSGGGSGGGSTIDDENEEKAAALEDAAYKATDTANEQENKKTEDKPKKEVDPVFNNRYLIPMVMAEHCEISASEIVEDINVLHECVRKYVSEIHNEDTNASFEGGKDFELLQYKLLMDNIVWALRTSLTIAHYEEMQNKQAEARSQGSTQRDMEAGMSSSKAFSINVVNNIIDTTADYLKYRTLSRMTLLDPSAFGEDETESTTHVEYFDGYAELWSNDGKLIGTYNPTSMNSPATTEGGLGADVTTAKATVETNEMVDENAMNLATNENKAIGGESSGACVITSEMAIQKGDYKNVGDNKYLGCREDGSIIMTHKNEDGSYAAGNVISLDQAQTMLDTVDDLNNLFGGINLGGGGSTSDDKNTDGEKGIGSGDAGGGGAGGGDSDVKTDDKATDDGKDVGSDDSGSDDKDTDDEKDDDDANANKDDEDKDQKENNITASSVKYTGVYKGRQLYPDIMAHYCEINAEDMALDVTMIEDCLIEYIKAMHDEDTIKSDEAHKDYLALKAAALMSIKSQAETKQGNIENFRTNLAEKYEKAANTSDNSQGDNMVIAETEAFLTDVINALREMYIERMKYESINNVENVSLETALAAQPQGTMLETVVVTPGSK